MTTKTVDGKGRLALGKAFANSTVIVERVSPTEIRIIKARVVREDEAWLWDDEEALASVKRGLTQARDRQFAETATDLTADDSLANGIDE